MKPNLIVTMESPAYQSEGIFIPPMRAEIKLTPTEGGENWEAHYPLEVNLKEWFVGQLMEQGHPEQAAREVAQRATMYMGTEKQVS